MKKPRKFPYYESTVHPLKNRKPSAQKIQAMEVINVDGDRYIREDMVESKMEKIMERIAVAQETQAAFYNKYDKMMSPLIDTYMAEITKSVAKLKKKSFGEGQTIGGFES